MKKVILLFSAIVALSEEQKKAKSEFLAFAGDPSTKTLNGFDIDKSAGKIVVYSTSDKKLVSRVTVKQVDPFILNPGMKNAPKEVKDTLTPQDIVLTYDLGGTCQGRPEFNLVQDVTAV